MENIQFFSFGFHEKIARNPNILIYFAKPCHSWERGADENTDGGIRRHFQKGTDYEVITERQAMRVQDILNSRAREKLGYMTPKEKYELLTDKEFAAAALSA